MTRTRLIMAAGLGVLYAAGFAGFADAHHKPGHPRRRGRLYEQAGVGIVGVR